MKKFRVMLDYSDTQVIFGSDIDSVKQTYKAKHPDNYVTVHELMTLSNGLDIVKPNYLSNSSMQKFYKDPVEFALQYTLIDPPERFAQTYQMMFGSAFDGYVKNYMVSKLYDDMPEEYALPRIIHDQCERQFWDKKHPHYKAEFDAFIWGAELLEQYKISGALGDLMAMLRNAAALPKFEFTVTDKIVHKEFGECVILGKPDVYFETKEGAHIIFDFKCNSIMAKSNTSPKKAFAKCSDGWVGGKQSRDNGSQHRDAILMYEHGVLCNFAHKFQDIDATWCDQTTAYSWLMGSPVGGSIVVGIHQLVGQKTEPSELLKIRVAQHYYPVDADYQFDLLKKYCVMWEAVQSGHIFMDMSREDSDLKLLELAAIHSGNKLGSKDAWLSETLREKKYFG